MKKDLLTYINTYNRTETTLPLAILSILNQTYKPDALVIFDENKEFKNPLDTPTLKFLLDLAMEKGIQWYWERGECKGAHFNHERANMMGYKLAWFLDDDHVAEPNCLENLMKEMVDGVGAVSSLILKTPVQSLPINLDGTLNDVWKGQNIQWYKWTGKPKECEHLYSSFLYRCNVVNHDLRLSKKVFRGETMFTHSLFLKGYKLLVTPDATTWHFEGEGGCRTKEQEQSNSEMYGNDNQLFENWLNFKKQGKKLYVLDNGLGDHYMFLQAITPGPDALIACCYPSAFPGRNVLSIEQAKQLVDIKDYNIYQWCAQNNWKGTLIEAFKKMYE